MATKTLTELREMITGPQKSKAESTVPIANTGNSVSTGRTRQEKLDALNQKYTAGVTPSVSPISGATVPSTTNTGFNNTDISPSGTAAQSKTGLNLANTRFTADKGLAIWDEWQKQEQKKQEQAEREAEEQQAERERYYTEEYGQSLYDEYEKLKNTYIGMDRGHVVTEAKNAYDQWRSGMFTHEQSKALDALDEETIGYLNAIADYNIEVDAKTLGGGTAINGSYVQYDTGIIDAKKKAVQALRDKGYTQEEIDSLAEYQQYRRNAEETEKLTDALKSDVNDSALGAIGANVASVILSPTQGLGMVEFLNRRVNKYAPLDVNSPSFAALNAVEAVRDQTAENIQDSVSSKSVGNALTFLYQVGMSTADSAALVATMGPASTYLMGTSAAASAAKDITERGGSVKQAFTGAVAAGAIEVLTEKFSVDNLLENAPNQGVIRAMLQQAGIEATEEMTSEICNTLVDAANMGGLSNYQLSVNYYMQNKGMSEEEAKRAALQDVVQQVALAGLGGAISGGAMAGATNGINRAGARIATERQLGALQQDAEYSPISQYGNVDTETKNAPMEGAESTAINTDPAQHTAQEIDNINGDSADTVVQNMGSYHRYTQAELDALPTYGKDDYDAAYSYRDGLLAQKTGRTGNSDGLGAMDNPYAQRRANSDTRSMYTRETDVPESARPTLTHDVVSEAQSLGWARERVAQGVDEEIEYLRNKPNWSGEDSDTAGLILDDLRNKAVETGEWEDYTSFRELVSDKRGDIGRGLQSMKKWTVNDGAHIIDLADEAITSSERAGASVPENLRTPISDLAGRFDTAVQDGDTAGLIDIIKEASKIRRTGSLFSNRLSRQMSWALDYVANIDGGLDFLQQAAGNSIVNIAADYIPTTGGNKFLTYRRLSLLSKATTILRNFVSNNVFDPIDSLARDIAVPVDILLSKFTGTRSIAVDKSWLSQAKRTGSKDGFAKALIETGLDLNISDEGRYELGGGRTFKMTGGVVERLLSTWEKWSGYELNTTDELQKGGISAEVQRGIDSLYEQGKISDDSLRDGNAGNTEALYRTFQDDNALSNAVVGMRRAADNLRIGGENGVGVGELALPFAKVPTNLAVRAYEYSPAAIIQSGTRLTQTLIAAKNGSLTAAQQARAVQSLGRSITGTGLLVLSAAAALSGVIRVLGSGRDDEDKNKTAMDKQKGQYGTQINLSAFMRMLGGEDTDWRDDDLLMSLSFLDPLNAIMTTGALMSEDLKDGSAGAGTLVKDSLEGTIQSLLDLPVMDTISDVVQAYEYSDADTAGGKAIDAITELGAGTVSGLVPNVLKGIAQGTDLTQRNAYTSQNILGQTIDEIKAGIPGLRQTLPAKTDSYGNDMTYGEDSDDWFINMMNNNILPGSMTKYSETDLESELDRLYDETGLASAYPDRKAPNRFTYNGETYEMSAEQKTQFQSKYGEVYLETANDFITSEIYDMLDGNEKVEAMQKIKEYAKDAAKAEVAGQTAEQADVAGLSDPAAYIVAHMMLNDANRTNDWSDIEALFESGVEVPEDVADKLGTDYTKNRTVYDAGIGLDQYHEIKDSFNDGYKVATDGDDTTTPDYTAIDAAIDAYNSLSRSQRDVIDDVLNTSALNKAAGAAAEGIDTEKWFDIVNTYKGINKDEDKNATEKQTELEYVIDMIRGLTTDQKEYAKDVLTYSTVIGADAGKYNALTDVGLKPEKAKAVFDSIAVLTPETGKNAVSTAQKIQAISGTKGLTDTEKYKAFSEYSGLSSGQKDKAATAQAYGVPADVYAAAFDAVAQARKNKGSNSLSSAEISAALSGVDKEYTSVLIRIFSSSKYLEWVYAQ